MFAAILKPAYRAAQFHAQPGNGQFLGQKDTFVAKPAAHVGSNHPHLPLGQTQALGQARTHNVRNLRGGVNNELLNPRIPVGQNASPFHGRHHLSGCTDFTADFHRGVFHTVEVHRNVGLQKQVVGPMVVHPGRIGLTALQHFMNHVLLFVVQLNGSGDIFGTGTGGGNAHGHQFTYITHLAFGQRGLFG